MQKKQELEAMSTEELCAFLERDLELDSDPSQAMEAAKILTQREQNAACDVDAAWQEFCTVYRPFQSEDAPLLEWEETKPTEKTKKKRRIGRPRWYGTAAAAAVAAVLLLHGAPQQTGLPEDPNRELIGWNSRYLTQWIPRPDTLTVGKAVTKSSNAESTTQSASYGSNAAQDEWSRSAADVGEEQQEETGTATFSTASAGETEQPPEENIKPSGEEEDAGSAGTQGGAGGTVLPSDDSIFSDAIGTSDEENTTTDATAPQE